MKTLKFPDDFTKLTHRLPGGVQYLYKLNDEDNNLVSIVGGAIGLKGDGVRTFEMWDTKNDYDVQGYLTAEEINHWLQNHPLEEGE